MGIYRSGVIAFGATPDYLVQVDNVSFSAGIENALNYGGASIDPIFAGALQAEPVATFESRSIAAALTVIGFGGASIDPVVIYLPQLAVAGFATGAVHTSVSLDACTCILQSITASQGAEAMATFEIRPTFDGSNVPVAINKAASIPSVTFTPEKFTLGPMKIGTTTHALQSLTLNTGATIESSAKNGELYPSIASVISTAPTFDIVTHDLSLLRDLGCDSSGAPVGTAGNDVELFLRALTNQGPPASDTDAAHLKFAIEKCYIQPTDTAAGTTTVATQGFTGHIIRDGATAPVIVTANSAITSGV